MSELIEQRKEQIKDQIQRLRRGLLATEDEASHTSAYLLRDDLCRTCGNLTYQILILELELEELLEDRR